MTGLRKYQQQAIDALERDWSAGALRLGISLPTGTGKTHVMAELANRYAFLGQPVLVLVHRDTLVEQTERKMREHAAIGVTVGVVKAERDVVGASVTIASVHTLRSEKRLRRIRPPALIIVDEAHVSMSATYVRVFERFPASRVAGFTATWTRSDSKKLGDFWQKISFARDIRWAIKYGHLVPPKGVAIGAPEHLLDHVRVGRGGDFREDDLGEAVSVDTVRDNVVRGWHEHARDRSSVLFAPTVASAEFFRAGLTAAGIPAAGIYATTSPRDRRRIFDAYRRREISMLTTCTALAEGWDAPWCSAAFMVRPTKHPGLFIQMAGRVLRLWPGKTDALILDFVGTNGVSLSLDAALTQTVVPEVLEDDDEEIRERLEPGDRDDPMFLVGRGTKPIDLFSGSEAKWLTTEHGVPFIATHTDFYFVAQPPESDTWNVGVCPIDASVRGGKILGGRWLREGVDADDAINYATIVAVDDDASLARSNSAWRRGKPSQAQIYRARSIGCVIGEHDTRGDVADKLTLRQASLVLAPIGLQ